MASRKAHADNKNAKEAFISFKARGGENATAASSCCVHHQMMGAPLRRLKYASCGYLDNPNGVTEFKFLSASYDLASAMRESPGLSTQAGQMRKVFKDFRIAKTHKKKQRIVESVARTLLNMTPRLLSGWTIAATTNPVEKGFGYALYEIGTGGRLVDISDVNMEGIMDRGRTEVSFEGTVDHDEWNDLDGEGMSARLEDAFSGILHLLEDATTATRTSWKTSSPSNEESCPAESE